MNEWEVLAISAGLIIAYMYIGHSIRRYVQPIRLELAEVGETLLADDEVPDGTKRTIKTILNALFSMRMAVLLLILHPVAWFLRPRHGNGRLPESVDEDLRREIVDFYRKGALCIVANSPITLVLFMLEVVVVDVLLRVTNGISGTVSKLPSDRRWTSNNSFQH